MRRRLELFDEFHKKFLPVVVQFQVRLVAFLVRGFPVLRQDKRQIAERRTEIMMF